MAWIESHDDVGDHKKTQRLSNILNIPIPTAVGHLHLLWHYTIRVAWLDGDLQGHSTMAIARACWWTGSDILFISALQESEYMDGMKVHDWEIYARELIYQRKYNKSKRVTTKPAQVPVPVNLQEKTAKVIKKFIPPTLEEVRTYCKTRNNGIDAQNFWDKNESIGWVDKNGNKYKDWKAVVRTWESWAKATKSVKDSGPVKRPIAIVVIEKIASGSSDHDILHQLIGTYSEHEINEALMRARGKVQ